MTSDSPPALARILFLTLVAVLPLHTLFYRAEIAWKPWLVLLPAVAVLDVWEERKFPWPVRASLGIGVFLTAVLISGAGVAANRTFWHLFLALALGGLLLLVTSRHSRRLDEVLRVAFWSGAAMAATGFVFGLVTNGVFGAAAIEWVNNLSLVDRVNKAAYLDSGFVALTNWHQDPGYAALWTNLWLALAIMAWGRRAVRAPSWVAALVIGGLGVATVLTLSRTGWLGLVVAVVASLGALWRHDRETFKRGLLVTVQGALVGILIIGLHLTLDPKDVGGDIDKALAFRLDSLFELGQIDLGGDGAIDPNLIVADNRLEVWGEYLSRFSDRPISGVGLGTGWHEPGLQEPHNLAIELLAETGIVGALGFVVMLVALGRRGGPVAGAAVIVVGAASFTETVIFEPVFWLALGLWLAGNTVANDAAKTSENVAQGAG